MVLQRLSLNSIRLILSLLAVTSLARLRATFSSSWVSFEPPGAQHHLNPPPAQVRPPLGALHSEILQAIAARHCLGRHGPECERLTSSQLCAAHASPSAPYYHVLGNCDLRHHERPPILLLLAPVLPTPC